MKVYFEQHFHSFLLRYYYSLNADSSCLTSALQPNLHDAI